MTDNDKELRAIADAAMLALFVEITRKIDNLNARLELTEMAVAALIKLQKPKKDQ